MITLGWRTWPLALLASAAIHATLTVGVRLKQPGERMKSAGAPVSVSGTLVGTLGGQNAQDVEAVETSTETMPVVVAEPMTPSATEPVAALSVPSVKADTLPRRSEIVRGRTPPPTRAIDTASAIRSVAPVSATRDTEMKTRGVKSVKVDNSIDALRKARVERRAQPARPKQRSAARVRAGSNRQGAAGSHRGGQGGRSKATAGAMRSYALRVRSRILSNRPSSRRPGRVVIVFGLSPLGRLRYARILRRSGNASLNRAALAAVRRSAPFPRPPKGARGKQLRFTLPFRFI